MKTIRYRIIGWLLVALIPGCSAGGYGRSDAVWKQTVPADIRAGHLDSGVGNPVAEDLSGLNAYLEVALRRNRGLKAAAQDWRASVDAVPMAGVLPDPILSYGVFLEPVETRVGPQEQRLSVSQSAPWFGTLGLREGQAVARSELAKHRYLSWVDQIVKEVSAAYAEYYYLGAALRITRENAALLQDWERVIRARYTSANASYSDLVKAQVEIGVLEDRVATLEDQRQARMATLAALLDLDEDTVFPWPEDLPETSGQPGMDELRNRILEYNQELAALRAEVVEKGRSVAIAEKRSYPSFTLGLDWIRVGNRDVPDLEENGSDALMARVGINLPLWQGRYSAGERSARARQHSAEERLEAMNNRLESELQNHSFAYRDARRKIGLYRDTLIPKGEQNLAAAFAEYEAGSGGFLDVLDAVRALLEFQLSLERARADEVTESAALSALQGEQARDVVRATEEGVSQ